jgi:hypothetical protein
MIVTACNLCYKVDRNAPIDASKPFYCSRCEPFREEFEKGNLEIALKAQKRMIAELESFRNRYMSEKFHSSSSLKAVQNAG